MSLDKQLNDRLIQHKQNNLYRKRRTVEGPCSSRIKVDGKYLLSFCSNDYLGLANHPKVIEASIQAMQSHGMGSGASHLVSGHSDIHHQLECALAEYTNRDRVLLFSSGFMANTGVINALLGKQDGIVQDKLNHASLIDAGLQCGASFSRYLHKDMASLETKLKSKALAVKNTNRRLIVSDGIFSMDGDAADVPALIAVSKRYNASLMIDDAHGFGVTEGGKGSAIHSQQAVEIYMATLGKALGSYGAFVAGSHHLIESLIQFARSYIYTTAIPASVAAGALQALQLMQQESWRQQHLARLIQQFRQGVQALHLPLMDSATAIQPIIVGQPQVALALSAFLEEQGFWVTAIRPPTVPTGSSRLRITLSAAHSEADIEKLLAALAAAKKVFQL